MGLNVEHLRSWIGRQETKSELITPGLVDRFNATFDFPGEMATDDVAPLLIHLCLALPTAPSASLGDDGHPARGGFLPPVPLPRRMWAAGAFRFLDNIRVGETVTRRSTISDVRAKEGHTGPLCFVTIDHTIVADGRLAIEERQDIVYRDIDAAKPADAPRRTSPAAPLGTHRVTMVPTAPLLFRYSALTFNGHRIHYDAPYARDVEGYRGLIVHGPLQATLLVHLAAKLRGIRPATFEFRSRSPLFNDADFMLNANEEEDGLKLWTSHADGPVAMEARATW